ncbi:MAG: hypothetical protein ACI9OJ_004619 [Myxococcota bacterium]|jgi:hypothetical protein
MIQTRGDVMSTRRTANTAEAPRTNDLKSTVLLDAIPSIGLVDCFGRWPEKLNGILEVRVPVDAGATYVTTVPVVRKT